MALRGFEREAFPKILFYYYIAEFFTDDRSSSYHSGFYVGTLVLL